MSGFNFERSKIDFDMFECFNVKLILFVKIILVKAKIGSF